MSRIVRVRVQTHAPFERVEEVGLDEYKVWTTAVPEKGGANEAILDLLADFFDVAPSRLKIISGNKSRNKLIEVAD